MRKLSRLLFSRYTVSALILLMELMLLGYFVFHAYAYSYILFAFSALFGLLVFLSLINRDTNPEFKITWLVIMFLMPVFGGLLYLLFYNRRLSISESRFSGRMIAQLNGNIASSGDSDESLSNLASLTSVSKSGAGRAVALLKDDVLAAVYTKNRTEYYSDGEQMYRAMLDELSSAKKYIFLEYFIVEPGQMWDGILAILREKVKEGVEVRMLYDDIGSMKTVPYNFDKKLRAEGIKCYRFAKVGPTLNSSHHNRDHRKIAIIDGRVAFTGGVNIADEYINKKKRFGHWKDGGVMIAGPAARGFTRLFLSLYDLTVRKISDYNSFLPPLSKTENENSEEACGYLIPFGAGPAPTYETPVGKNILINTINMAKSYVYITTPYLIIDHELTAALRGAARRGVDVRIITPGVADKKIVKIMTKNSYPYLIRGGVRIFEYTPGFIHEKLLVSDDECAIIGTINLDYRSLVHHFEDGVFMYLDPTVTDIRDSFLKTESRSSEVLEKNAKLGPMERIIRDLIRIFAPLL